MKTIELTVPESIATPMRLDRFLAEHAADLTRSQLKSRGAALSVNGLPAKLAKKVRAGDVVSLSYAAAPPSRILPEDVPLVILYEDANVAVINKPQGMVVHPGSGSRSGTLAQGLLYRYGSMAGEFPEEEERPGIVHRLDKDTSGVLIAAKNQAAREMLAAQFRKRETVKVYLAFVNGRVNPDEGRIETRIGRDPRNRKQFAVTESGGRLSVTTFRVLRRYRNATFIALYPSTGRTHQLRVHMRHIGHPIIGDPVYGKPDPRFPLLLHSHSLTITLPGDEEPRTFRAPLPERFRKFFQETVNTSRKETG